MPSVLFGFEILPLVKHAMVGLHLWHGLGPFESIATVPADEIIEDKCVGSLHAVFGQHGNEQQVYRVGLVPFHHTQQLPPAHWQETSVACVL